MKKIDFERASALLDVMAKVVNVGPMNMPIFGEAQEELKAVVADCEANRAERAEKIRAEEQIAQQQVLKAADQANAEEQDRLKAEAARRDAAQAATQTKNALGDLQQSQTPGEPQVDVNNNKDRLGDDRPVPSHSDLDGEPEIQRRI